MSYLIQSLHSEAHSITLKYEDTIINIFYEEKTSKQRYNILINLPEYHKKIIESVRHKYCSNIPDIYMGTPHITHSIHYSESDAKNELELLKQKFPITVQLARYLSIRITTL